MSVYARRRRVNSREHWRPLGIIGFAIAVHLAFISLVPPPEGHVIAVSSGEEDPEDFESFDGVGGTFAYSPDCMSEAFAGALAKMVMCYFPFVDDRGQCLGVAHSWYRVQTVGCTTPEQVEFAEFDAVPLVDADAIDLAMLDMNLLELLEKIKQEKIEEKLRGQVVDTPEPATQVRPDDYEYLAEFDNKVEKQMVKRGIPEERSARQPPPVPELQPQEIREAPTPSPATAPPGGGALTMRQPGIPGTPEVEKRESGSTTGFEKVSLNGIGALRGVEAIDPNGRVGGGGTDGAGPGETAPPSKPLNLRPRDAIAKIAGGTNDHLPGVEVGDHTALNTRKWKYATFFNRVKRQVAQNWHPETAYRLRDPNGNIYGTKDRMTVLTVSIEPDGTLKKVIITGPSGVEFLDDEAVKAFELAEPFPNPPDALVDHDSNLITFRFGFSFEINSRTPWRLFRYR